MPFNIGQATISLVCSIGIEDSRLFNIAFAVSVAGSVYWGHTDLTEQVVEGARQVHATPRKEPERTDRPLRRLGYRTNGGNYRRAAR